MMLWQNYRCWNTPSLFLRIMFCCYSVPSSWLLPIKDAITNISGLLWYNMFAIAGLCCLFDLLISGYGDDLIIFSSFFLDQTDNHWCCCLCATTPIRRAKEENCKDVRVHQHLQVDTASCFTCFLSVLFWRQYLNFVSMIFLAIGSGLQLICVSILLQGCNWGAKTP